MADIFDTPPYGFIRAKNKGWSVVAPVPQRKSIGKLKSENADLKSRLEQLEVVVAELASKKKK